jgi:hypothetical protein
MRHKTKVLVLFVAVLWLKQDATLGAFPRQCSGICTSSRDCNTVCYMTSLDFENGTQSTCLDYGVYDTGACPNPPFVAGDGSPGSGEGATCGNDQCDSGESCEDCPRDCYDDSCGFCGDSFCAADEYGGAGSGYEPQCSPGQGWCSYCPEDCGECQPQSCWPQACGGAGSRYQCGECNDNSDCDAYPEAWCATGFGKSHLCNTWCSSDYDCPDLKVCGPNDLCVDQIKLP